MKVRDVIAAIEAWAPPGLAYSWDRCGLDIGDPEATVTKTLVALTVTRDVYRAARRAKAELIVSHHPAIWDPLPALRTDDATAKLCLDIAAAGIASYSAHTNLDVAPGGVNDILADRLRLKNRRPLLHVPQARQVKLVTFVPATHLAAVRDAVCAAGAGVIGEYTHCSFSAPGTGTFRPGVAANPYSGEKHRINEEPELRFETLVDHVRLAPVLDAMRKAHPYDEPAYDVVTLENTNDAFALGLRGELARPVTLDTFARTVRDALEIAHVRVTGDAKRRVKRVAVLGGAGGGSAPSIPEDVDVYVTGDVKYHEAVDANERGLSIVDAGHHGTEKFIVPAIADYLRAKVKGLRVSTYMEPDIFRAVTK